jgi:pilus assembly protein Flp/PilA
VEASLSSFLARFYRDNSGTTAIEYALIASLIAVVVVTSVTALGTKLTGTFGTVVAAIP